MWQIAAQLDASEQALWAENGLDSEEYLRYIAEGSSNVADNGMFSVQARTKANPHQTLAPYEHDNNAARVLLVVQLLRLESCTGVTRAAHQQRGKDAVWRVKTSCGPLR